MIYECLLLGGCIPTAERTRHGDVRLPHAVRLRYWPGRYGQTGHLGRLE